MIIGSDSGKVGTSGESVSAACRGRAIAFAKSIAREYARHNVLANVVARVRPDTGLWDDLVKNDEFGGQDRQRHGAGHSAAPYRPAAKRWPPRRSSWFRTRHRS